MMIKFFSQWESKVNAEFMEMFMPEKQWDILSKKEVEKDVQ